MATIQETLTGITMYPIPLRTLIEVTERFGCSLTDDATKEKLTGKAYNLAKAELLLWLSLAPNVTQGGQSYSFTDEQRLQFRNRAYALQDEFGETEGAQKPVYGYKGSKL